MGREIVEHDADALGFGKVHVCELAHAVGEVDGGAAVGDFDLAPGPVRIEEDKEIDCTVAPVFAIEALTLPGARPGSACGPRR